MTITSIGDAVRALIQSFQVATIFPAGFLVFINLYVLLPCFVKDLDYSSFLGVTVTVTLTLMISYILYAFNFPLIRVFEGYKRNDLNVIQWLNSRQRKKFRQLTAEIDILATERAAIKHRISPNAPTLETDRLSPDERLYWEWIIAQQAVKEEEFDEKFPASESVVLPTSLGNIIAAFEDYPRSRYGIEPIALWPRLVPLLRAANYTDFVNQEKSVFDFLLNTLVVTVVLIAEFIYVGLYLHDSNFVLIGCLGVPTVPIIYQGLLIAARQWGTTVRVAFDLYRHDLRKKLGIASSTTFAEECERWIRVSNFLHYRPEDFNFADFVSSADWDKQSPSTSK